MLLILYFGLLLLLLFSYNIFFSVIWGFHLVSYKHYWAICVIIARNLKYAGMSEIVFAPNIFFSVGCSHSLRFSSARTFRLKQGETKLATKELCAFSKQFQNKLIFIVPTFFIQFIKFYWPDFVIANQNGLLYTRIYMR